MKKLRVEVCMISARGLSRPSSLWRLQWYAVGWIDPNNKYCTKVDASGSKNPTWKTKFSAVIADDNEGYESKSPTLNIQVFSREPIFLREKLQGTATILLREFIDKYYSTSNMNNSSSGLVEEVGSFQLRKKTSGKPQGLVDVSIRMSEDSHDAGGGNFPGYQYSGNNGEGFELGGGGGSQVSEIFIGGGRWSNVEDQRLHHHHHSHQSDPDIHPQLRSAAQGRWSDMEDYPPDPHQLPDYSNSQQDYPPDPHQTPDYSHSRQPSAFHGGASDARHSHPHTQPNDFTHSQSQLHPETQGRWSNAEDDHHISPPALDHSQQRSPPQGRWSNVRTRRRPNTNNQHMDSQSRSQMQPETQGGWPTVEDHHSSQHQPDQFHSQSRTAAPPNWRQQPKGTYPDSQSNDPNQQSFSVQSTQSSYRPPPPPPPPPSHVGFLPSFLPTADPRFSSAYGGNRRPGGGTAPAGHGAGPRNNSGAAVGMSAGALAAGAVLFGDDFISGFDIPSNSQEETPYYN